MCVCVCVHTGIQVPKQCMVYIRVQIFVELVTELIMPHIVKHENFRDMMAYKEMRQQERTYTRG